MQGGGGRYDIESLLQEVIECFLPPVGQTQCGRNLKKAHHKLLSRFWMIQRMVVANACCQFTGGKPAGLLEALLDMLSQATGGENYVDEIKEPRYPNLKPAFTCSFACPHL